MMHHIFKTLFVVPILTMFVTRVKMQIWGDLVSTTKRVCVEANKTSVTPSWIWGTRISFPFRPGDKHVWNISQTAMRSLLVGFHKCLQVICTSCKRCEMAVFSKLDLFCANTQWWIQVSSAHYLVAPCQWKQSLDGSAAFVLLFMQTPPPTSQKTWFLSSFHNFGQLPSSTWLLQQCISSYTE